MTSIGEELVNQLAGRGVETVFGIPGVHTVELYRGLAASSIRHVTPRHEQGAGFMTDGYARVSGCPGVAFVITGPGLTNTLTAMGQARADSVPILVISGVNALSTLGKGKGHLHELPNQRAMAGMVALTSERIETGFDLIPTLDRAFANFSSGRPGPSHIEVPLDVAGAQFDGEGLTVVKQETKAIDTAKIARAARVLEKAKNPVILAGGGVRKSPDLIRELAEKLDAPVVQTVNARGLMHGHPLGVPASPSLKAVRGLIEAADVVLAVGTECGPTDYDMYETGTITRFNSLIRIDICEEQLSKFPSDLTILGDAADALAKLNGECIAGVTNSTGSYRAERARHQAFEEIGPAYQAQTHLLDVIRDEVPNSIIVGDSTQPIYAGNLYYDHDVPGGWFNASTGFGALGYAIPAAIGAALAAPNTPVICITGDGGAQFSLPELMVAMEENLSITFVVWNNYGYQEIETSMAAADITIVGCDPTPPDFAAIAASYAMPFQRCQVEAGALSVALRSAAKTSGPTLIEMQVSKPPAAK